jgi:hypothetical protein
MQGLAREPTLMCQNHLILEQIIMPFPPSKSEPFAASWTASFLGRVRKPNSPSGHLATADKLSLEKKAKQDLRLANRALKEHNFTCDSATKRFDAHVFGRTRYHSSRVH